MIKVKGTRNKKFQKRILILTGIVALLFTAWSLLNFNGMLKKTEKNKKYDNVTEWTEQNARLIEYKTARYYEILESAAARIKDMSLDSEETQRFLGRTYSKKETHFVYMRILNNTAFICSTILADCFISGHTGLEIAHLRIIFLHSRSFSTLVQNSHAYIYLLDCHE